VAEDEEIQGAERPYRVLSLDGGGMRGIYTAAFLGRLTDQFARIRGESALDLGRGFDLSRRALCRRYSENRLVTS
jgi:patatin-like phospholipase/acyl hydrolase